LSDSNRRLISLHSFGPTGLIGVISPSGPIGERISRAGHATRPIVLGFLRDRDGVDRRVLSYDRTGEIRIWETDATAWPCLMGSHVDTVFAVAARPGTSKFVSASNDRTVRIWDRNDPTTCSVLTGHADGVLTLAISDDGLRLATGGHQGDPTIRLWDLATDPPTVTDTLDGHASEVHRLRFCPDGRTLASAAGHGDSTLRLWDLDAGTATEVMRNHPDYAIYDIAFVAGGDALIWCDGHGRILRRDASGLSILEPSSEAVRALASSPDGAMIASVGDDALVRVWDIDTCFDTRAPLVTLRGHSGPLYAVAWSPDGRLLASGGLDGQIYVWDPTTGRLLLELAAHANFIFSLLFVDGGDTLIASGSTPEIAVYDLRAFDRHIAGQLELQIARRADRIDPTRAASLRNWAAEVLVRARDDAERVASER